MIRAARLPGRFLPLLCLALAGARAAHAQPAADRISAATAALADPTLRTAEGVRLTGLRIQIDLGELTLEDGWLVPGAAIAGKPREFAFVGKGRLVVRPPDAIEAGQLEVFTGSSSLSTEFESAAFVFAADSAVDALWTRRAKSQIPAPEADSATTRYATWRESTERKRANVDLALASAALADPGYSGYAALWLGTSDHGDVLYLFDPDSWEQVSLGQFVALEASAKAKKEIGKALGRQQRRGRAIGVDLDDFGDWNQWLSGARRRKDGSTANGLAAVEPEHYEIDLRVADEKDLPLEARASVRVGERSVGRRAARFTLHPDLELLDVATPAGDRVPFLRRASGIVVALDPPLTEGENRDLVFRYRGKLLDHASRAWGLSDTLNWYPRTGDVDRATYDVTFHWPERLRIVASGSRVDGGKGPRGEIWERRRLDSPAVGFSFEIGRYRVVETTAGRTRISVAFDPDARQLDNTIEKEIVDTIVQAVDYYSKTFGPYPLPELDVVTVPRTYSQGLAGFVTLSTLQLWDFGIYGSILGLEDRRTVIAHEIAHQWWGNEVGFASYRDVWMTEALANYSALAFARHALDWKKRPRVGPTSGWQQALTARTSTGRPIETLGPVVLGPRLVSSFADDAYVNIVYLKGAIVLDMMAKAYGEESFLKTLAEIVRVARGKELTTGDFVDLVGTITSSDLSTFADTFIYGTGLPDAGYRYEIRPGREKKWCIEGNVRLQSPERFTYSIRKRPDGRLDAARRSVPSIESERVAALTLTVPIQVKGPAPPGESREMLKEKGADRWTEGRLVLHGASTDFSFELDSEPKRFYLDLGREVYVRFFDETRELKRVRLRAATAMLGRQELDAAEAELRKVLSDPVVVLPPGEESDDWPESRRRAQARQLDALAHLGLARVCLDRGRTDCEDELDAAKSAATSWDRWLVDDEAEILRTRLDVARGQTSGALKRLRKTVLRDGELDETEAWILLAIAAAAEDDADALKQAREELDSRQVDVSELGAAKVR